MARWRPSIIATARGHVGGIVMSRDRYGAQMRGLVAPTNPHSAWQSWGRYKFGSMVQAFQRLTPAQQTQWDDFAASNPYMTKSGRVINLTGRMYYAVYWNRATQAWLTPSKDPGSWVSPVPITFSLTYNSVGPTMKLHYTRAPAAGEFINIGLSASQSPGVSHPRGMVYFVQQLSGLPLWIELMGIWNLRYPGVPVHRGLVWAAVSMFHATSSGDFGQLPEQVINVAV